MENEKEFLGTQSIPHLLFRLSIPTVAAQIINVLYNIVDRIYIGHMPGDGAMALTGVGVCMPIILIVSAFAALVSSGGAPRASICMGRQDMDEAEQILGNCFSLLFLISAVLSLLLSLFHRPILMAFGASTNTIEYACDYMRIYAIGTIFVQMTLGLNMFITAQGFAKTGMLTVLIGAVCNIGLDPVLIFGLHMGVSGAALATVISQAVSCIWCILFLCGKRTRLKIKKDYFILQKNVMIPCVLLGTATFIMQASESILSVCFNSSLLKYGGDVAVGAMTICTSIMQFAMLPLQGVGQGAQPIISYNYGARDAKRVKDTFRLLIRTSMIYSLVIYLLVMAFPGSFAAIFSSDKALLAYASGAIRIYCAVMVLFGIQVSCQLAFVSLGNAPCSIIVAVVRKFVLLIPLIYLVPLFVKNKAHGVYMAEPIADLIAVSFTAILFSITFRKMLKQLNEGGL